VKPERSLYRSVRFSPDGKRIAHSNALRATLGGDIFVTTVSDGSTVRVTSDSMYLAPEWSVDGRRIMFASNRTGGATQSYLIAVDAAGGGTHDTLLARTNRVYEHALTADGKRILWREDVGVNARDILSGAPRSDEARPERASRFDERGIALSPDGQWYLYTSTETGRSEVYLSRLGGDGARWRVSPAGGAEPRWARNGEIFYRTIDSVYVTRASLGPEPRVETPRALFADDYFYVGFEPVWDVAPDGKHFVLVAVDEDATATIDLMINWIPRWRANTR
jgi:Tol biopolymer transport system component